MPREVTDIEYCYSGGDLVKALQQAAAFVEKVGEDNVALVDSHNDEGLGWTVLVVYRKVVE